MGLYRSHVVVKPETIQAIATQQLNDTSQWHTIVEMNDLYYPYIVPTNAEKMKNPEHLVTYGDRIMIPTLNQLADTSLDTLTKMDRQDVYDMSLGMDIQLDLGKPKGIDDRYAYMTKAKNENDVTVAKGIDNLKQSIRLRLLTRYGTLMYVPMYGSHLLDMLGEKMNADAVEQIKIEIKRTVKTDSRVSDVDITDFLVPDGRSFFCIMTVTPLDEDDAFELFIEKAQDAKIKIG